MIARSRDRVPLSVTASRSHNQPILLVNREPSPGPPMCSAIGFASNKGLFYCCCYPVALSISYSTYLWPFSAICKVFGPELQMLSDQNTVLFVTADWRGCSHFWRRVHCCCGWSVRRSSTYSPIRRMSTSTSTSTRRFHFQQSPSATRVHTGSYFTSSTTLVFPPCPIPLLHI